jgi:MFS family permease
VAVTGAALIACASALLVIADSTALILPALLVFGAGMGGAAVSAQIAALSVAAEKHSGLAAGPADSSFAVGTALGVGVCGNVAGGPEPQRAAFATAGVFACLGLAAALALLPGRRQPGSVNSATVRHESRAADPATRRARSIRAVMGSSACISAAARLMLSRFARATLPIVRCGVESGCSPR